MEWKQVISDAQGGKTLPMMKVETESLATTDATTASQEKLVFERVIVRYFVLILVPKILLHDLCPKVTLNVFFISKI